MTNDEERTVEAIKHFRRIADLAEIALDAGDLARARSYLDEGAKEIAESLREHVDRPPPVVSLVQALPGEAPWTPLVTLRRAAFVAFFFGLVYAATDEMARVFGNISGINCKSEPISAIVLAVAATAAVVFMVREARRIAHEARAFGGSFRR